MPQFNSDSPTDIERQFHTEGDALKRHGFQEPILSREEPEGFAKPARMAVEQAGMISAVDEAAQHGIDVETFLEG